MLLKETAAFVVSLCNVMQRLTEAERLEDDGNLTAVETVPRDSDGSAAPSSLSVCWRNVSKYLFWFLCSFQKDVLV